MGLQNASQQFQQMIDDRLHSVRNLASPYIDDILVGTWVDPGEDLLTAHNRDVRKVLELLKRDEFIVGKWKLFVKEEEFCGYNYSGSLEVLYFLGV